MCSQLHAPVTLPPRHNRQFTLCRSCVGPKFGLYFFGEVRHALALAAVELLHLGHQDTGMKYCLGVWLPERESKNVCLYNTCIKKVWIVASTLILQS